MDRLEQWSRHVRATGMFEMLEGDEWADYLSTQVYALVRGRVRSGRTTSQHKCTLIRGRLRV